MGRNLTLALFFALVAAHVALAASFASITPFRTPGAYFSMRDEAGRPLKIPDVGAPDERQHVNYIARLTHGGGFPVLDPKDPFLEENYQAHQPPVFYVLGAAWATVTGVYLPPTPPATEGKEMTVDDGLKLRALNVVIGAVTVGGVFMLAFWGFRRPEVALVAAAVAALLPMNAALSGAVSNDPLLICLSTWTLALVVHGLRDGWTTRLAVGVGVLSGLAVLTKTTGAALFPVLLMAILLKGEHRPNGKQVVAALVPILVLVLPWWMRNQNLYGDPMAISAFNRAFENSPKAAPFIAQDAMGYWYGMVFVWTARSFVGAFGYMDIWLTGSNGSAGVYQLAWLLFGAAAIGWLLSLKSGGEDKGIRATHLVNGLFFVIVVLLFVGFNNRYFQAQARYVMPAIGPIACATGLGLCRLLTKRPLAALGIVVLVLGFADVFALTKVPGEFAKRVEVGRALP